MSDETSLHDAGKSAGRRSANAVEAVGRYDFRSARTVSRAQLAQLDLVNERFCRDFPASLSALIRRKVSASVASSKYVDPTEGTLDLTPTALTLFLAVEPASTRAVLGMNPDLVFALFEALLGGGATDSKFERSPTDIELSILQDLQDLTLRQIEAAWKKSAPFRFQADGQGTDLKLNHVPALADGFVAVEIQLQINSAGGLLLLLYPAVMVKELGDSEPLQKGATAAKPDLSPELIAFRQLRKAILTLEGYLQGPTLKLKDLVDLQVNDLVCLDAPLERPIDVLVNGEHRFHGQLLSAGQKRVIRVERPVQAAAEEVSAAP